MPSSCHAWVYILASRKKGTSPIGVTTDLRTRVAQHKSGAIDGFTQQHRVTVPVCLEELHHVMDAMAREKALRGWNRRRKIALIEAANLDWNDLAAGGS